MTVNYRCPTAVIDAARHLLSYNARRLDKDIHPPAGQVDAPGAFGAPLTGGGPVAVLSAPADGLAALAVETIAAWRAGGVDPADIAVLARVNSALLPVQVACMESGVPCSTPLSAGVLQRTGIRTAFAYLRIGADPEHITREDVIETIRRPSRGIAPKVVDMLTSRPTTSITDIRRLAGRLSGRDVPSSGSTPATSTPWCAAADDRLSPPSRPSESKSASARPWTCSTPRAARPTAPPIPTTWRRWSPVAALHPDVATFEPWLREVLSRTAVEGPSVLLSTIHRIKGREWDHVIIFGRVRGLFPHRLGNDEEGERHVFTSLSPGPAPRWSRWPTPTPPPSSCPSSTGPAVRPARRRRGPADELAHPTPRATGNTPGHAGGAKGKGSRVFAEVRCRRVGRPGLVVDDRGTVGTVVEVTAEAAILSAGTVRIKVALGADVRVDGHERDSGRPGRGLAARRRGGEGAAGLAVGDGEPGSGAGLRDHEGRGTGRASPRGILQRSPSWPLPRHGADPPRALGGRDTGCARKPRDLPPERTQGVPWSGRARPRRGV